MNIKTLICYVLFVSISLFWGGGVLSYLNVFFNIQCLIQYQFGAQGSKGNSRLYIQRMCLSVQVSCGNSLCLKWWFKLR